MSGEPTLTGYGFSVYTRAARMALAAKRVSYSYEECNPFAPGDAEALRAVHPFGRVPALRHGGFHVWETQAILDYVEAGFDGPPLTPQRAEAKARMRQVMGINDAYLYWPLVRGVVSNALFASQAERDGAAAQAGLDAAPRVLAALEEIAGEGEVLVPGQLTLADCLLWPMLDYFRQVPEGAALLRTYEALTLWAETMAQRPEAMTTAPDLNQLERSPA